MHIFHREKAGRPPRVMWALEEVGMPYDVTVMTLEEAGGEDHRARHPLGRVPVVDTGEGLVFESAAVILHLADTNPDAGLLPALGTLERALAYQWAFFAMTEIEAPAIAVLTQGADTERLEKAVRAVDEALEGQDYILGSGFSAADIILGSVLFVTRRIEGFPAFPNVDAYLDRLEAREARQHAYAKV